MTGITDTLRPSVVTSDPLTLKILPNDYPAECPVTASADTQSRQKGGRLQLDTLRCFITLIPIAAAQVLRESHDCFLASIHNEKEIQSREISVNEVGTAVEWLGTVNLQHTVSF